MKLTVKHVDMRSTNVVDTLIEERIFALQPRLQIEEASVRLEHRPTSPPFRVSVHLVIPGPDIVVEEQDHTIRAAIEKVMSRLEENVSGRALRRKQGRRNKMPGRRGPEMA